MEKMAEYFRPDTWSLLMVDEPRDELYFAIAVGATGQALKNARLKVGEGIAGWVAKHGERAIVPDVESDARFRRALTRPRNGDALRSFAFRCAPSSGCWV